MNKVRLFSVFVILAMVFSFANVSSVAATSPNPLDDGGWELVAHMSNSGGMFDGNGELMPGYAYGTFNPNPVASTPDFQRAFPVVADKILFITGDLSIWGIADYGDLRALIDARGAVYPFPPNLAFEIGANGVISNTTGNVLSRPGVLEDPWITMDGGHYDGINNQRIVWGENNYGAGTHQALKNNHGGINVYVKATVAMPTFSHTWGSLGTGNGQFDSPIGISVDTSGNVYVADTLNNRIQKFDSNGTYLTQWGSLGTGNGQFDQPYDVAVDANGDVFVADILNHRIQKFDSNGTYLTQWGSLGPGNGQFNLPIKITFDASDNIYVADHVNSRIQKFDSNGSYLSQLNGGAGSGKGQFLYPTGIAVDASGNIYVNDFYNDRIQKYSNSGSYLSTLGSSGTGNGQFDRPYDVTVDANGNIYVTESGNNRVQVFDSSDVYLTQWGSLGSGNGQFNLPREVAFDASGNIYVTESGNNRVQVFSTAPTDTSGPTATVTSVLPAANGSGWNNTDVTVTWNWSDEAGGSGIDNATCTTSSTSTGEGEITLTATCKDLAGNEGSVSYTVMVDQTLPVADAGLDQSIHAGYTVNLDGSASSDDNTTALSYNWSFFSTPGGNTATLNNADTATPSFTPNVSGEYVAQLIVTDDADNDSEAVFVTLSSLNMAPTGDATATPMLPILGQAVSLDGTASSDPDGDTISYQWTVTSKPVGSVASLTNATSAMASITPDVSGTYELTLTVSDFLEAGTPVTVSFVASTAEEFSQMQIINVSSVVVTLEPAEITTAGNQEAFGNFLTNTMSQIQKGNLNKAIADLEKAIARTDGCALRGTPDGNGPGMDWVTTCEAQASIYNSLVEAWQVLLD